MGIKVVLFDIDDTLISAPPGRNKKSSNIMFKKVFNIDAHEEMIQNSGKTEKAIIEEVLALVLPDKIITEIPKEAYIEWANATAQLLKTDPATVLPGIKNILEELSKRNNTKLGLLTGNSPYRALAKIKAAELEKYFQNKNGTLKGGFGDASSSRVDLLEIAKENLDQKYSNPIIVDDSLVGAHLIKSQNLPGILVATGRTPEEQLREFSPFVFEDFGGDRWKEVIKVIENLD